MARPANFSSSYAGLSHKHSGSHKYRDCDYVKIEGGCIRKLTAKALEVWHARMEAIMEGPQRRRLKS